MSKFQLGPVKNKAGLTGTLITYLDNGHLVVSYGTYVVVYDFQGTALEAPHADLIRPAPFGLTEFLGLSPILQELIRHAPAMVGTRALEVLLEMHPDDAKALWEHLECHS